MTELIAATHATKFEEAFDEYQLVPFVTTWALAAPDVTLLDEVTLLLETSGLDGNGRFRIAATSPAVEVESDSLSHGANTALDLSAVRSLVAASTAPLVPDNLPFAGGVIGYLSYEACIDPQLRVPPSTFMSDIALWSFARYDEVIIEDMENSLVHVVTYCTSLFDTDSLIERHRLVVRQAEATEPSSSELSKTAPVVGTDFEPPESWFRSSFRRVQNSMSTTELTQMSLSRRFSEELAVDAPQMFRALSMSSAPVTFMIRRNSVELICASPVRLVSLSNGLLRHEAIGGTRVCSGDESKDNEVQSELLADPKELAEHDDVVEAGRFLIERATGRSCETLSSKQVRRAGNVMHMVTTLGSSAPELDPFDAIATVSPAPTVTGRPRQLAIEGISQEEEFARGLYGGTFMWLDHRGHMDSAVIIRCIGQANGQVFTQASAGITPNSTEDSEVKEILNKASVCVRAIESASTRSSGEIERRSRETF